MTPTLSFCVLGIPRGKERPRFNRKNGTVYTPKQTRSYEQTVRVHALAAMAKARWEKRLQDRYSVSIVIYWPNAMRRDIDNVAKATTDALNNLIYHDDAYIYELHVYRKFDAERPRVEICVKVIGNEGANDRMGELTG